MKKTWFTVQPYLEEGLRIVITIFAVVAILIFIGQKSLAVFYRYPLDYGEAPLVDQTLRLLSGETLYRHDLTTPPYTISNYPPLYPLSMAPLVALFGPEFWPGRLISTLSALATALFLSRIVRAHTGDRAAGRITGALFLAIPYVVGWSSLARVDFLALALSAAGLLVLSQHAKTRQGLFITGVLLVAAVYTRQSYGLAAPLAACAWLWFRYGWRRAAALGGIIGGLGMALLLLLNSATRGGFFFNIITANVNPFRMENLLNHWRDVRETLPLLLGLGALGLGVTAWTLMTTRNKEASHSHAVWTLAGFYVLGAAIAALTIGKIGSNVNYLLELAAALSLMAGVWLAGAPFPVAVNSQTLKFALRNGAVVLVIMQMGLLMRNTLQRPVQDLKARRAPAVRLNDLLWEIRGTDGTILADEFMGLLTLNDRALYLQPFEMTQLANAGIWDQTPLLESIREQQFSMILIHHFMGYPVYKERWTPEMLDAIFRYYIADGWAGESIIFRPRNTAIHPAATLQSCPNAPWKLPTRAELGVWWLTQGLIFMGAGEEGQVPVYAVADGLLMRQQGWQDAVAILHDDPVRPGAKVWTYYAGMASGWSGQSLVNSEFPPGAESIPVKKGQLLGFQGQRYKSDMRIWLHSIFGVAEPLVADGGFPMHLLTDARPSNPDDRLTFLDPSPYLGTAIHSPVMGTPVWHPLRCLRMGR